MENNKNFVSGQILTLRPCSKSFGSSYYNKRMYELIFPETVVFLDYTKQEEHAYIRDEQGRKRICNVNDLMINTD